MPWRPQDVFGVAALAGPRIADVDGASGEIGHGGDPGIGACDKEYGLGVHAEDTAQRTDGLALPVGMAGGGLPVAVRLRHSEIEQAAIDGIDVEHRTQGRASDTVVGVAGVLVDQIADMERHLVVDAGDGSAADQQVTGRCLGRTGDCARRQEQSRDKRRIHEPAHQYHPSLQLVSKPGQSTFWTLTQDGCRIPVGEPWRPLRPPSELETAQRSHGGRCRRQRGTSPARVTGQLSRRQGRRQGIVHDKLSLDPNAPSQEYQPPGQGRAVCVDLTDIDRRRG